MTYQPDAQNVEIIEKLDTIEMALERPINPSNLIDAVISLFSENRKILPQKEKKVPRGMLRGMRILLVEDNSVNQQIAQELLEMQGVNVSIANNGKEAIATLEESGRTAFDVVLMDLQMPEMDGHEATMILRQRPEFDDLPIIAMTAHAMAEEKERCSEEGMNGHITKPVAPQTLYRVLQKWHKDSEGDAFPIDMLAESTYSPTLQMLEIPGLDLNSGLSHVAGNKTLYLKLLRQFRDEQADVLSRIRQVIDDSEYQTAERLAHTLVSICGNLGANDASSSAALLEKALRTSNKTNVDTYFRELSGQLDPLLSKLTDVLPKTEKGNSISVQVDKQELKEKLATLLTLCENGDGDSIDLFEKNIELFQAGLSEINYRNLNDALDAFAFDEAYQLLEKIVHENG